MSGEEPLDDICAESNTFIRQLFGNVYSPPPPTDIEKMAGSLRVTSDRRMSEGALCVLVLNCLKLPLSSSSLLPTNERHSNQRKDEWQPCRREGEEMRNVPPFRDKRGGSPCVSAITSLIFLQ